MDIQKIIEAVKEAGEIIKKKYHENVKTWEKMDKSDVTEVDIAVENYLKKKLLRWAPGFIGEETAGIEGNPRWILDPLDGTTNFILRIPYFAISLALKDGDETKLGIVYNPMTADLWYAEKGKGAYWNGRQIRSKGGKIVSSCYSDKEWAKTKYKEFFDRFILKYKDIRKLGSASLEISSVAAGILKAFVGFDVKIWDFAAAELIAKEAGAYVRSIEKNGKIVLFVSTPEEKTLADQIWTLL